MGGKGGINSKSQCKAWKKLKHQIFMQINPADCQNDLSVFQLDSALHWRGRSLWSVLNEFVNLQFCFWDNSNAFTLELVFWIWFGERSGTRLIYFWRISNQNKFAKVTRKTKKNIIPSKTKTGKEKGAEGSAKSDHR